MFEPSDRHDRNVEERVNGHRSTLQGATVRTVLGVFEDRRSKNRGSNARWLGGSKDRVGGWIEGSVARMKNMAQGRRGSLALSVWPF